MSSESDNEAASLKASSACDDNAVTLKSPSESGQRSLYKRWQKRNNYSKHSKFLCSKLMLPDYLAAYLEERELDRDILPFDCNTDTLEKIFNNYVIVKNILRHLCWQDKMISKDVSPLWNSAVNRLHYEQLYPVDFSIKVSVKHYLDKAQHKLLKSSEFHTEPMAVFTFCNMIAMTAMYSLMCEDVIPPPCSPACNQLHCIIDILYHVTTAPRNCMYIVKAHTTSYLPLPQSITVENIVRRPDLHSDSFFCGLCIPKIPGIEFKMFNCPNSSRDELISEIKGLTAHYIIKGVVACLTDNYLLYVDQENVTCLQFLHEIQPDIPFAFGGCLVEDTVNDAQDLAAIVNCMNTRQDFISGNILSIGVFVTPKVDSVGPNCSSPEANLNFETYSLVLPSTVWNKSSIHQQIQEFSEQLPHFEHSVALKFSCTGRHHKHDMEQQSFRKFFPRTRLIGCFGNGELGVNHFGLPNTKRDLEITPYDKVHSYSSIIFFIGWGKIYEERDD